MKFLQLLKLLIEQIVACDKGKNISFRISVFESHSKIFQTQRDFWNLWALLAVLCRVLPDMTETVYAFV